MLEWYKDDDIAVYFSEKPDIDFCYPLPQDSKKEKKAKCAKPFKLKKELSVTLKDYINCETYSFTIPMSYEWDGASIPWFFWRLVGAKTDSRFAIPSLIHDFMCENHNIVDYDRYLATRVFERLLYVSEVHPFKRWYMFHSVDNFQKFCGWRTRACTSSSPTRLSERSKGTGVRSIKATSEELDGSMRSPFHGDVGQSPSGANKLCQ